MAISFAQVPTEKQERFSERCETLALDVTLPIAPAATISSQSSGSHETQGLGSAAFEKTIENPAGKPRAQSDEVAASSLPRISLGGTTSGASSSADTGNPPDLELSRTLGEGGMGNVHEAHQRSLRRHVAVKTLKEGASPETRNALLSEARVTGFLEHPGIIPIHSLGLDEQDSPVLVMKRVQGVPWSELLDHEDHPRWEFWVSRHGQDRLLAHLEILSQVCDAVHFAHSQGIVHRDIKPENVMLGSFGEIYLVDWGLAIRDPSEAVGQLVGTPAFMAPEMAMGDAVDARGDVYLLGATLHQIITGSFLHNGNTLKELLWSATESARFDYHDDAPAELAALAAAATSRAADERPESAEQVRQAIANYLAHRNSIAVSDAASERLSQGETLLAKTNLMPEELAFELGSLCAEARFGFEQALETWPENDEAQSGLWRCLELLVETHLLRRDPHGASAQLALMDTPPQGLRDQISALEADIKKDEEERERMNRLRRDLDRQTGLSQRIRAFLLIVVAVVGISLYFLISGNHKNMTNGDTVIISVGITVVAFFVTLMERRTLLGNLFGRRIASLALIGFLAMTIHRLAAWRLGIPVHEVFLVDLVLLALVGAIGGVTIAGWIFWMAPISLIGVALMTYCPPSQGPVIFSVAAALALVVAGGVWFFGSRGQKNGAP